MSIVKIQGNASGTGILTIAAPNTNSDRTLTLPDQTGTVLTNAGPYTASSSASAGAVTIDASNNVGIGTSSPTVRLQVTSGSTGTLAVQSTGTSGQYPSSGSGMEFVAGSASAQDSIISYNRTSSSWRDLYLQANTLLFGTAGSERARIDSSGNLLVGTTSPASNVGGFQVSFNPGTSKYAGAVVNTKTDNSTVTNGFLVKYTGVSPTDGNYIFLCQDSGNTNRFYVTNAGGTGGTSDATLKKNIETTRDGYVNDLCKIRIVKYNWKTQDDNAPKYLGWIAQEVEEVFPRMVETDPETGFKSVTYSPFVPMLIKAVQEQQALIESLTARIAALEAK